MSATWAPVEAATPPQPPRRWDSGCLWNHPDTFDAEVLRANGPVVVDFWAPWCSPCHAVALVLEAVAAECDIKLVKVNYDEEPSLADHYGVRGIPNMILFRDGAPVAQGIGAQPRRRLASALGLTKASPAT